MSNELEIYIRAVLVEALENVAIVKHGPEIPKTAIIDDSNKFRLETATEEVGLWSCRSVFGSISMGIYVPWTYESLCLYATHPEQLEEFVVGWYRLPKIFQENISEPRRRRDVRVGYRLEPLLFSQTPSWIFQILVGVWDTGRVAKLVIFYTALVQSTS